MDVQLFLVAPQNQAPATLASQLADMLEIVPVAALLLPRGTLSDEQYEVLARQIIPVGQKKDCAVLLEDASALAKKLNADGVHINGGIKACNEARQLLGQDMIVGAADLNSRHDAMSKGEAGVDYVFFGKPFGEVDASAIENAQWWAETFEIPCVLYTNGGYDPLMGICEFAAFGGDAVWSHADGPVAALVGLAKQMSEAA